MATQANAKADRPQQADKGIITEISVAGFKSIRDEQSIELRPLTILAGANSSGKSSIMQSLLLLKQTLEAPYDPGALKIDGPNVAFSDVDQLLSRTTEGKPTAAFHVGIQIDSENKIVTCFDKSQESGIDVSQTTLTGQTSGKTYRVTIKRGMSSEEIWKELPVGASEARMEFRKHLAGSGLSKGEWKTVRERCFLRPVLDLLDHGTEAQISLDEKMSSVKVFRLFGTGKLTSNLQVFYYVPEALCNLIHLPGLRGNPERTYRVSAVGDTFPGMFQDYVASVVARWQDDENATALKNLADDLRLLGLTWTVQAKRVSGTGVELQVGRLVRPLRDSVPDLVSIADVGFGVSQALPVLVALQVAAPEQLVYVEQPELHLHPRAQAAMAEVLARAVHRGARIVAETHSSVFLLAVQALVAEGKLSRDLVKLHWFSRSETDGATTIRSTDLDEAGAFGDWPEDFGDVEMDLQKRYLDAAEARMSSK